MDYVRDAWYVASWSHEIKDRLIRHMSVRQFACTLCAAWLPRTSLVCTKLGCTRSAAQGGEKLFKEPLFLHGKSLHFVRVLMYHGFVSGGLGTGRTTSAHLIQYQCNHVFHEDLCVVKRCLNFCDDVDVY